MTERAPRDRCWLHAPSWCDGRRALSGTLLPGAQAARQSWQSALLLSASFASRPGPPHTTHTTWRRRKGTSSKQQRSSKGPRSSETEPPRRPSHSQRGQKRHRPGVLSALIFLGSNASLLPVYCSAPLPVPAGSFQKRGVPPFQCLAPPSLSLRPPSSSCRNLPEGGRSLVPTPHSTNRPMANDLPFETGGKIRREQSARLSELLWFPFASETVLLAERVAMWFVEKGIDSWRSGEGG